MLKFSKKNVHSSRANHLLKSSVIKATFLSLFMLVTTSCSNDEDISEDITNGDSNTLSFENSISFENTPRTLRTVRVKNPEELQRAINNAKPGDLIRLANGTYRITSGFKIENKKGTNRDRITIRGSKRAIITQGSVNPGGGQGFRLINSNYWVLKGFTVKDCFRSIILQNSNNNVIDKVKCTRTGNGAVRFFNNSDNNTIKNSEIEFVGLVNKDVGEGVYIGTSSGQNTDQSWNNKILNNKIGRGVKAQLVDIKPGSKFTVVKNNRFDGSAFDAAGEKCFIVNQGSKGTIEKNTGVNSPLHGVSHKFRAGWGKSNTYKNNNFSIKSNGFGFYFPNGSAMGNKVFKNNTVSGGRRANIPTIN